MVQKSFNRKLTAILSADVKGYSRLMRMDEEATVHTLTKYRAKITGLVSKYNGRVVDSPGDNLLAEFVSVVHAVQCGFDIQALLESENAKLPEDRRMMFRIGINLGDVIQEKDRIYGDGVNVAARMESLAEAGGITVTGGVYDQIVNKLTFACEYLGKKEVKNISTPIRAYQISSDTNVQDCKIRQQTQLKPKRLIFSMALLILLVSIGGIYAWRHYQKPKANLIITSSVDHSVNPKTKNISSKNINGEQNKGSPAEDGHGLYFIDAHSQIDHIVDGVDVVLKRMSANNVTTTLLSARGERNWRDILYWSSEYPAKIAPLVRSKGKPYLNNTPRYFMMLQEQFDNGAYVGAAEIVVFHAQKGNHAPRVAVNLSDNRVSVLLNESLSKDWPVIIHIEYASLEGLERQRHMDGLKSLLEKHPWHPFILIHMGQLRHDQVQGLIERHTNVYFLTSRTDPVTAYNSNQPWINIFSTSGTRFKESWRNLFIAYPDRFIFALDNVRNYHWQISYNEKMKYWKKALADLPEKSARLIAHGNAERLWKLKQN